MPVNLCPQSSADEVDLVDLVEVLRALADPVRLRIVTRSTDGEYHLR